MQFEVRMEEYALALSRWECNSRPYRSSNRLGPLLFLPLGSLQMQSEGDGVSGRCCVNVWSCEKISLWRRVNMSFYNTHIRQRISFHFCHIRSLLSPHHSVFLSSQQSLHLNGTKLEIYLSSFYVWVMFHSFVLMSLCHSSAVCVPVAPTCQAIT